MGEDTSFEQQSPVGTARTLTYGEKAVGLSFNPGGHKQVDAIKTKYAEIIDMMNDFRTEVGQSEAGRLASVAITEAQAAQMWAVKAITWK